MKKERGREAGKCSEMVPDRGDRCLFTLQCSRRLFFNILLFPVCKAQLIGDWHENRQGTPKRSVRLFSKFCFKVLSANRRTTGTGDLKCREVKLDFVERGDSKPVFRDPHWPEI